MLLSTAWCCCNVLQLTEQPGSASLPMSWLHFYLSALIRCFLTQAHVFSRGKMHFFLATKKRPEINLLSTERLAGRLWKNKCVVITKCQKLPADRKLNAQFTIFLDERQKKPEKFPVVHDLKKQVLCLISSYLQWTDDKTGIFSLPLNWNPTRLLWVSPGPLLVVIPNLLPWEYGSLTITYVASP